MVKLRLSLSFGNVSPAEEQVTGKYKWQQCDECTEEHTLVCSGDF